MWAKCNKCGEEYQPSLDPHVCKVPPVVAEPLDAMVAEAEVKMSKPPTADEVRKFEKDRACPHCGRPIPMTNAERQRRFRERRNV